MKDRLQFRHDNHLYNDIEEIKELIEVNVKDIEGRFALYAEPIVFKYGNENNPNIVLAIGNVGNGTAFSKNNYFLIDTNTLIEDIKILKERANLHDEQIEEIVLVATNLKAIVDNNVNNIEELTRIVRDNKKELNDKIDEVNETLTESIEKEIEDRKDAINDLDIRKVENKDLQLIYNRTEQTLMLRGKNNEDLGTFGVQDFIKDGMISNVELVDNSIVISWNTDGGDKLTTIPLKHLIDIYKVSENSKSYLSINEDYEVSVIIGNEEEGNYNGLTTASELHKLSDSLNEKIDSITIRIDNNETSNNTEIESIKATIADNKTKTDASITALNTKDVEIEGKIQDLENDISNISEYSLVKTTDLTYEFRVNGEVVTTIDIPKDSVVSDGEVKGNYLYLYLNSVDETGKQKFITIPVSSLISELYTVEKNSEDYLSIKDYKLSIVVDENKGVASYKLVSELVYNLQNEIDDLDTEMETKLSNDDVKLIYDRDEQTIMLRGKDNKDLGTFGVQDFIKDGMISNVELVDNSFVISWNTDGGDKLTSIPLKQLIDAYKIEDASKPYLKINANNEIGVIIGNEEEGNYNGLATASELHKLTNKFDEFKDNSDNSNIEIKEGLKDVNDRIEKVEEKLVDLGDIDVNFIPTVDDNTETVDKLGGINVGTLASDLKGKSISEVLTQIIFPEVYPSVATKPSVNSISYDTSKATIFEVGSSITVGKASFSKIDGRFNASFTQDTPIYTQTPSFTYKVNRGFNNYIATSTGYELTQVSNVIINLGTNEIVYTASLAYTEPNNKPTTSYGNETTETGATSNDHSATWTSGTSTKTAKLTAYGTYPCYSNISGGSLVSGASVKYPSLTTGNTIQDIVCPSEVISNRHFVFEYPTGRNVTFQVKDLSGKYVNVTEGTFKVSKEVAQHVINGKTYVYDRLEKIGDFNGELTFKVIFSSNLSTGGKTV